MHFLSRVRGVYKIHATTTTRTVTHDHDRASEK